MIHMKTENKQASINISNIYRLTIQKQQEKVIVIKDVFLKPF